MKLPKLKRCPNCGCKPKLYYGYHPYGWSVGCFAKKCSKIVLLSVGDKSHSKLEASNAWNKWVKEGVK